MERLSARCARQGHALPGDARLFQTIDAEHTRLRHAAEKRCGQLSYGHPLSPELRSAGENIRYLKRQRQEAYLRRAMEPPEARARTNTLLVQLQTELKGAWKHMKNTQTIAAKIRSRSNTERATRQSQQGPCLKHSTELLAACTPNSPGENPRPPTHPPATHHPAP
jgi:septal ring factor EnvC (AmiA/AmiB activator)